MASKIKVDQIQTGDGTGTIALQNQLSGMTSASMPTGSVLQVVNATYSTTVSMSSDTYADTGLTASITPSSTSSKILVVVNQQGLKTGNNNATNDIGVILLRGSTEINLFAKEYGFTGSTQYVHIATCATSYLDSPSSTSAVTYKTQFANNDGGGAGGTIYVQSANTASTMTLMEIAG